MDEATIHLSDGTLCLFQQLSQGTGRSIPEILDQDVEEYGRKILADDLEREFAVLKADADAWADEFVRSRLLFEIGLVASHLAISACDRGTRPPIEATRPAEPGRA